MIRLTVSLSNHFVDELVFTEDQERIRIGRTPENDVVLGNLALSRRHAEIVRTPGGWRLRDLGSRNGLHVNGTRRIDHDVDHGDVIVLGKFSLRIELGESFPSPDGGRDSGGSPRPSARLERERGGAARALDAPPPAVLPDAEAEDPSVLLGPALAHLTVVRGTPSGVFVVRRNALAVGGGRSCELRLRGLVVPRVLALIVRGLSGFSLVNVSPRCEGVYRNGKPVPGRSRLEDGDRVELHGLLGRFRHGPPRPLDPR